MKKAINLEISIDGRTCNAGFFREDVKNIWLESKASPSGDSYADPFYEVTIEFYYSSQDYRIYYGRSHLEARNHYNAAIKAIMPRAKKIIS